MKIINSGEVKRIQLDHFDDNRGFFNRVFCENFFNENEIIFPVKQINYVNNNSSGQVRGLHYQNEEYSEDKYLTCISGGLIDYALDVRPNSQTFGKVYINEINYTDNVALLIPKGFAHGYQTLQESTSILYLMSESYKPENSLGYNILSPKLNIKLPLPISCISDKDKKLPYFE